MLNFCFLTPKRHILAHYRVVCRIIRENRFGGLGCGALEEPLPPQKKEEEKKPSKYFDAHFAHTRFPH